MFPLLSLTVTLKEKAPAAEGVPLMSPVAAFRDRPPGSDPRVTVQLL